MQTAKLTLYSTAHCSLCDTMLDMLLQLPEAAGLSLQVLDVADQEELFEQYAERIPVLRFADQEYSGPLELDALRGWIQSLSRT